MYFTTRIILVSLILILSVLDTAIAKPLKITPQTIDIIYELKDTDKNRVFSEFQLEQNWLKSCPIFGNFLTLNQGIYNTGVFDKFSCLFSKENINQSNSNSDWIITIHEYTKHIEIKVLNTKIKEKSILAYFNLEIEDWFIEMLENTSYSKVLAFHLLSQLPFSYKVKRKELKEEDVVIQRNLETSSNKLLKEQETENKVNLDLEREFAESIQPSDEIFYYYLSYETDEKIYRSTIVGKIGLNKSLTDSEKVVYSWIDLPVVDSKVEDTFSYGHGFGYKDDAIDTSRELLAKFASNVKGQTKLKFDNFFNKTLALFSNTVAKGYVGIRYGPQIFPGDDLLSQTELISVLAEIRGGPFSGVRFYYDVVPEKTAPVADLENTLQWSRALLGYSVGVDLNFLVNRIDFVPKVGMWTYNADLIITDINTGLPTISNFNLNNELSLGAEFGIEKYFDLAETRVWFAIDTAFPSKESAYKVSTTRFGVDFWWKKGPKIFSTFNTAFLLFGLIEDVSLEKINITESTESQIKNINMSTGYTGLGVALSW